LSSDFDTFLRRALYLFQILILPFDCQICWLTCLLFRHLPPEKPQSVFASVYMIFALLLILWAGSTAARKNQEKESTAQS